MSPRKKKEPVPAVITPASPTGGLLLTRVSWSREDVDLACADIVRENATNAIISVFYMTVNPALKFSNPFQRKDAGNLILRYGAEGAYDLAKLCITYRNEPFFPSVNSPSDLWKKLPNVLSALKNKVTGNSGQAVIRKV